MGRTKEIFILDRERQQMEEIDCDGNCLECIRSCETTPRDIEQLLRYYSEDSDYGE